MAKQNEQTKLESSVLVGELPAGLTGHMQLLVFHKVRLWDEMRLVEKLLKIDVDNFDDIVGDYAVGVPFGVSEPFEVSANCAGELYRELLRIADQQKEELNIN